MRELLADETNQVALEIAPRAVTGRSQMLNALACVRPWTVRPFG